jgi:hypothetical protein
LTRHNKKQVLVVELALDPETKTWLASSPGRGTAVVRHETGHALDAIHEISSNDEYG